MTGLPEEHTAKLCLKVSGLEEVTEKGKEAGGVMEAA